MLNIRNSRGRKEKAMAPHSSILAWKIPWMEEPGGLQSMGSLRVRHDWATHFHFSLSCTGEGNGNPLQCSCLENLRDKGAWWAAIYGVTQSQTRLKWLSSSSSSRRRREKEKVWENFWRDYSWEFPQHRKRNSQSSLRGTKSPIQDKPKEKHAKTHTNQSNKD